jgi:hypothetical protein
MHGYFDTTRWERSNPSINSPAPSAIHSIVARSNCGLCSPHGPTSPIHTAHAAAFENDALTCQRLLAAVVVLHILRLPAPLRRRTRVSCAGVEGRPADPERGERRQAQAAPPTAHLHHDRPGQLPPHGAGGHWLPRPRILCRRPQAGRRLGAQLPAAAAARAHAPDVGHVYISA